MNNVEADTRAGGYGYLVHGLLVRAPFELNAEPVDASMFDLHIGEGTVPDAPHSAEVLLCFERGASQVVAHRDHGGRVWVTFPGLVRFLIDGGSVTFEIVRNAGLGRILCEGWILAMVLFLADHAVLHASAVVTRHGTYAFAGNSGSGKSTLAGLLCREGGLLVADDVARVDVVGSKATVRRGATALRLRPAAFTVAEGVEGDRTVTVDERLAFTPSRSGGDKNNLDAVLLPLPDRSIDRVEATWLEPSRAAWELLRRPRLFCFVNAEARRRELAHAARVAGACRVGFLRLPWGPPWPTDLSERIATAIASEGGIHGHDRRDHQPR